MMDNLFRENRIRREETFFSRKRLSTVYGYIVDLIRTDIEVEEDLEPESYIPVVAVEGVSSPASRNLYPVRMADPPSFLVANYGSPRNIIGRRVRIDYRGTEWHRGKATIVDTDIPSNLRGGNRLDSTGFLFARAGSVER